MSTQSDRPLRRAHRNPLRPVLWGGATGLLLLPAIAMRFDTGVDWSLGDFLAAGVMLATACGLYEIAVRSSEDRWYRAGFGLAVVTGFLTVWVNLAVGMFGSEQHPVNLVFAGVLLVAAAGALRARFRAPGMAAAMAAACVAQLVATGIGVAVRLTAGLDEPVGPTVVREAVLTAAFALPWAVSAVLFRAAAR